MFSSVYDMFIKHMVQAMVILKLIVLHLNINAKIDF